MQVVVKLYFCFYGVFTTGAVKYFFIKLRHMVAISKHVNAMEFNFQFFVRPKERCDRLG